MDEAALPSEYRRIWHVVEAVDGPGTAKDVCTALGPGIEPRQVEPMRDKLSRLAQRGWLRKTPDGRFTPGLRHQAGSVTKRPPEVVEHGVKKNNCPAEGWGCSGWCPAPSTPSSGQRAWNPGQRRLLEAQPAPIPATCRARAVNPSNITFTEENASLVPMSAALIKNAKKNSTAATMPSMNRLLSKG
ncbi:hypothetical protein [Streptomyces incanus]|uniref:Uncharacterized protein n=1 Tax=Streptomyces incanus TaxID=887453 RepID=A0ABW0XDA2_9ACTN